MSQGSIGLQGQYEPWRTISDCVSLVFQTKLAIRDASATSNVSVK